MFEFCVLTLFFLALTLFGEGTGRLWLRAGGKPLASMSFVAAAWLAEPLSSSTGVALFCGLILSALGDVLLLKKGSKVHFLAGLGAFLFAHIAYVVSFVATGGVDWALAGGLSALGGGAAVGVSGWLLPSVPQKLKAPVVAYLIVISVMVVLAWSLPIGFGLVQGAATLFFLSDISVAIDRFKEGGFLNRLWGLPAYYLAQLLFVLWWAVG